MIRKLYGVEMQVPAGKLPGFFAQVIHKIGDNVTVFDRDQQLFIVSSEADRDKLIEIFDKYHLTGDLFGLWLLPEDAEASLAGDYGFSSAAGHTYLYDELVAFFRFDQNEGLAQDRWAALEQMKEHLIASLPENANGMLYIVDKNQVDLIDGIARAYKVSLVWL
jgi:hypothetical protein